MAADDRRTGFTDLPSCLVMDILSRLHIKTQFICRYVRKDWVPLYFSDPYFIKLQLARSHTCMIDRCLGIGRYHTCTINQCLGIGRKIRLGWIADEEVVGAGAVADGDSVGNNLFWETMDFGSSLPKVPYPGVATFVNSCNGLVCLKETSPNYKGTIVRVCNPLLGEWVDIPIPDRSTHLFLGFSAKNNQYKLLHLFFYYTRKLGLSMEHYGAEIYTLGSSTRQWRNIEVNRGHGFPHEYNRNTFLHDSLHWNGYAKTISSFNFYDEKFRTFSYPPRELLKPQLGVLNSCLAVFDKSRQHIWVMKEYGDEKSWSLMFAFEPSIENHELEITTYHGSNVWFLRFLSSLNQEEVIMCDSKRRLFCLDTKTKRLRSCQQIRRPISVLAGYNPSFVSLHDVAKGEQVMYSNMST